MPTDRHIRALVLAAGCGSRFGGNKMLQTFRGVPLVRHAVRAAQSALPGNVWLVTGDHAREVAAAAEADHVIVNDGWQDGMGTSVACGVRAVRDRADALIVMLGDQPLVTAVHIANLVAAWSGAGDEIVATRSTDSLCPPVLFASGAFDALSALRGDAGAKAVMRDPRFTLHEIPFADAAIDVDTREDLESLRRG